MGTITASKLTDLCALAEKYGTDKLGVYTPFYDLLFNSRRCEIFKVLEVGIGTPESMKHVPGYVPGASLRMWRDYFPHADIFALDKDLKSIEAAASERIYPFLCDQASVTELEAILPKLALGGRFDLIVDDGSHKPNDQLRTFNYLSKLLARHGIYIIEDVDDAQKVVPWLIAELAVVYHHHQLGVGQLILIRGEDV